MKISGSSPGSFVKVFRTLGVIVGVCLFCLPLFAQANLGSIQGAVTDQSGAAIPGCKVTVLDVNRGISRRLITDSAGQYSALNLLPGTYTVSAECTGFQTFERRHILMEVGTNIRVDITPHVGATTQTVVVSGTPPAVNTTNSTLGGTALNGTINALPLNGRNYLSLLTLRPGVQIYPGGGAWSQSTNGMRPEDNTYIVDGLTNDNPFDAFSVVNGPAIVGDSVTVIPIDGIQEFSTQVNPQAEYGWKPGAVVNVELKSGTNKIHGTAYAFGRSDALDALNYFSSAPQPIALEEPGATAGGPIIKNKLFWFGGYEAQRYTIGTTLPVTIPSLVPGGGPGASVPDAEADLAAHGIPLSPLSLKLLTLFPQNTNGTVGFPDTNSSDNFLGKLDYTINDRNSLSGTVFYARDTLLGQDNAYLQPQWRVSMPQSPLTIGGDWIWTPSSRWVNEARLGYIHVRRIEVSDDDNVPATAYGINTGITNPVLYGMPQISVAGFSFLGGSTGNPKYDSNPSVVWQGIDNVSYLRGTHLFKFGVEVRRNGVTTGGYQDGKGAVKFSGGNAFDTSTPLEDFLAGVPERGVIDVGNPVRDLTSWWYAAFAQDDWRATPRLTWNLGLRYEYVTPIREDNNQIGNFDPTLGLVQAGNQIGSPYPYQPDFTNFAPRLGMAWDLTGKGTTVLRAGFGMVYSQEAMEFYLNQGGTQNAPTLGLGTIPTGATIVENGIATRGVGNIATSVVTEPGGLGSALTYNWQHNGPTVPLFSGSNSVQCGDGLGSDPAPCDILGMARNFRTPYVSMWNIGIQHAFSRNASLEVDYVGNEASELPGVRDLNQGTPIPGSSTAAPGPYSAEFPYLGFINYISNMYTSNYNGLQTTFTLRPTHGLYMLVGYTYAHALDNSSVNFNESLPQNSIDPSEYASSDYDIRNRLTLTATYAFPDKDSPGQMLKGWSVDSVVTIQSGMPWTVNDTVDNISGTSEASDRWDFFGKPSDFTSGPHSIPYCTQTGGCSETTGRGQTFQLPSAQSAAFFTACSAAAAKVDGGSTTGPTTASLDTYGCYAQGGSVMIPPAVGTFGTMGRNIFPSSPFSDWDLAVSKDWRFGERVDMQARVEFFNILNHPDFANPYGGTNTYGAGAFDDPSSTTELGCGCATPDQAAGVPLLGSGANRSIQLGLKFIF